MRSPSKRDSIRNVGALLAPGAPEHPARSVDRFAERRLEVDMAREHGGLRLRLPVAAHGAVGHDASVVEHGERRIERVERQPARA